MGIDSESLVESNRPAVFRGSDGVDGVGTFKAAESTAFVKFVVREERESLLARPEGGSVDFLEVLGDVGVANEVCEMSDSESSPTMGVA
jgi:hypothetical protein